jgi:transcriptional regulator with XRE-family HTH domain
VPRVNPPTGDPILDALRRERERRGWSQHRLANEIGRATYQTIFNWESGTNEPILGHLRHWAAALGFAIVLEPFPAEQPEGEGERPVSLHEQLLAAINQHGGPLGVGTALRAVAELHAPASDQPQLCRTCWNEGAEDYHGWPCSTIQAIARELGVPEGDDRG